MNVLHLIASFGPGGAERQLSLVAPALARSGVEVHVAYCSGGPNLDRLEDSGVHLHALTSAGNHDPVLAWKIFQLVRRLRPDVVQTWLLQMDTLGGAAALLNDVPLVISERSSAELYRPSWKTRLRILIGRKASCVVANSNGGIDYWRPHINESRLRLIRNCITPVDDSITTSLDSMFTQLDSHPIVLYAGRFSHEKNIPMLVDALIRVAHAAPQATILMFGQGPEREFAREQVERAGLSARITLAGYSPNLAEWMRRATVCVSVSHFEGHPNVVLEAAAAGCPLVLSDIASHREMFNPASALLVARDSPDAIASAVLDVVRNPQAARERAAKALAIASQYNLEAVVAEYSTLYESLNLSMH
jgi:glycosyltransferase involved in cell wall biosynthesis